MTSKLLRGAAVAALFALAGCGGGGLAGAVASVASVVPGLPGLGSGLTGPGESLPAGFTEAELQANPDDYVLMTLPSVIPSPGLARVIEDNGARVTYRSQYGYTATYENGVLVATRGLPDDLLAASVGDVRGALRRGGGTTVRVHDMLNSLNQIEQTRFECEIRPAGTETITLGLREARARKFTESCSSPRLVFENSYWLGNDGQILSSSQFISVTVAYLRSNEV